jgi:hypothetical protein
VKRRPREEDSEFKARLGYTMKPSLQKENFKSCCWLRIVSAVVTGSLSIKPTVPGIQDECRRQ